MIQKKIVRNNFTGMQLKLASPERIKQWSYGEILKPETINYRTGRSERGGLFDERVFGPTKSFECYCGKYKRIRYKDIICEKCGVQVTDSIVRRERMGHIELASPVTHIWYLKGTIPAPLSLVLGIQQSQLDKVVYFAGYIITKVDERAREQMLRDLDIEFKEKLGNAADEATKEKLRELLVQTKEDIKSISLWQVLDEVRYNKYAGRYSNVFEAGIGAEAIYEVLKSINLEKFEEQLKTALETAKSLEVEKLQKRISIVRGLRESGQRPEWMCIKTLPVIPPGLRPMVALEGGRHATSDVNDLYRRVINRNNRLKKLKAIGAPDVILRNEKRILQEAVDSLLDNSARGAKEMAMNSTQRRQLKSLADNLQGKQGMLRQNLLGKRVDYSARSVIVVGPRLDLNECGLPKHMALELFKPFIISKILEREMAFNIKGANKLIEEQIPEVWAILEEVIQGKYVLLNRAPTLHRLGIQAFKVKLIEGMAIQLHPLVCVAFNADFDGDQMAVHLPLSEEAQMESREIIAAHKNLLKPGDGVPSFFGKLLDIVLGVYWMTTMENANEERVQYFSSPNEAILAHENGAVSFRGKIKILPTSSARYVKFEGKVFETTVGRLLFNTILPNDYPFVNELLDRKAIIKLLEDVIDRYGLGESWIIFDKVKNFAFGYATKSGVTFGLYDVNIPVEKKAFVQEANKLVAEVESNFNEGFLSDEERYKKIIEIWAGTKSRLEKSLRGAFLPGNPIADLVGSGARGNYGQLNQMAGMKGLIQNNTGRTLDFPIVSNYKEGLSPIEYFVTSYGARKGGSDTALKTAQAGYFTRRLVDVAQDTIITEEDCGTKKFKRITAQNISGIEIPLWKSIWGRNLAEDVVVNGKVLFTKGQLLKQFEAKEIEKQGIKEVAIFTPITCESERGICQKCYGLDMGRGHLVRLGEAVGIVAAQAIGEPGTQLTMRTFHSGGVAEIDITQGLPRVIELLEVRMPKAQIPAVISPYDGEVLEVVQNGADKVVTILLDSHETKTSKKGKVSDEKSVQLDISSKRVLLVKKGDKVKRGELITDGSADIDELFNILGAEAAQEYIATEVTKVYELQGATISRKHLDIIVRQMFNRVAIVDGGDTKFSTGDVIPEYTAKKENRETKKKGGQEAKYKQIVQGITQASLTTESWLSAASFQNTTKILIKAATRGQMDELVGLKENVIAGRLVPVGTGYSLFNQNKKIKVKDNDELNGFIDKENQGNTDTVDESNEKDFMDEKTDNA
jgi:DNA-directed RNA polymerase subunit beta'